MFPASWPPLVAGASSRNLPSDIMGFTLQLVRQLAKGFKSSQGTLLRYDQSAPPMQAKNTLRSSDCEPKEQEVSSNIKHAE